MMSSSYTGPVFHPALYKSPEWHANSIVRACVVYWLYGRLSRGAVWCRLSRGAKRAVVKELLHVQEVPQCCLMRKRCLDGY